MSYGVLSHRQYGFFMSIQMMWVVPADDAGFFCIMPAVLRPVCLSSMPVLLCFPPGWGVFGPRFQGVKRLASPAGETNGRGCAYIRQDKTRREPAGHRQCVPVAWLPVLPVCLRAHHSPYPARRASILGMSVLSSLCVMASVPRPMAKRGT